jgi:autotransporter translocation and assembly factor TamB
VGKELVKNKLYVTYSSNVGASYPEQMFRIEYLLTRHFSLVGARDELGSNGADIKYRFEFK